MVRGDGTPLPDRPRKGRPGRARLGRQGFGRIARQAGLGATQSRCDQMTMLCTFGGVGMPAPDGLASTLATAAIVCPAQLADAKAHPPIKAIYITRVQRFVLIADRPRPPKGRKDELPPQPHHRPAQVGARRAQSGEFNRLLPRQTRARAGHKISGHCHGNQTTVGKQAVRHQRSYRPATRTHAMTPTHQGAVGVGVVDLLDVQDRRDDHGPSATRATAMAMGSSMQRAGPGVAADRAPGHGITGGQRRRWAAASDRQRLDYRVDRQRPIRAGRQPDWARPKLAEHALMVTPKLGSDLTVRVAKRAPFLRAGDLIRRPVPIFAHGPTHRHPAQQQHPQQRADDDPQRDDAAASACARCGGSHRPQGCGGDAERDDGGELAGHAGTEGAGA